MDLMFRCFAVYSLYLYFANRIGIELFFGIVFVASYCFSLSFELIFLSVCVQLKTFSRIIFQCYLFCISWKRCETKVADIKKSIRVRVQNVEIEMWNINIAIVKKTIKLQVNQQ